MSNKKLFISAVISVYIAACSSCSAEPQNGEFSVGTAESSESEPSSLTDLSDEQQAAEYYSELIKTTYSAEIKKISCFETDSNYACVSIVMNKNGEGEDVIYADGDGIQTLLENKGFYDQLYTIPISGKVIIIAEEGYGGSGSRSHVWVIDGRSCKYLDYPFSRLKYEGGNDFSIHLSAFDVRHTRKKYYLFWDGEGFREYGGIIAARERLEEIAGGAEALELIEENGFTVGDIFYRANGVININYSGGTANENMTLIYADGRLSPDTSDKEWYDESLGERGNSYGGIYLSACMPEIAVYPDKLPF